MNKSIEIAKELVKQGMSLAYCPEDVKNDKESVLAAVRNNGADLQYASDELKNDKEVVLAAINNQTPLSEANVDDIYSVIRFASVEIKKNKEVALEAVKKRGNAFIYLSDELKNDKEVAITAIKGNINNFEIGNGYLLQYASSDLQNDKEVVMETIKANAKCYEFASPEIQKEINKAGGPKEWLNKQEDIRNEKKIDFDKLAYDCSKHEIYLLDSDESWERYDLGYSAQLKDTMHHILKNKIIDYKSNITFGEQGMNFCEIGRYDDMPGIEEKEKVISTIPKECWDEFFLQNAEITNDIANMINTEYQSPVELPVIQENHTLDQNGRFTTGPSELAKNFSDVAKQNNNSISKDKNITTPTHKGDAI